MHKLVGPQRHHKAPVQEPSADLDNLGRAGLDLAGLWATCKSLQREQHLQRLLQEAPDAGLAQVNRLDARAPVRRRQGWLHLLPRELDRPLHDVAPVADLPLGEQ
eukprot:6198881-Pyramimonas_sp.AAC.1